MSYMSEPKVEDIAHKMLNECYINSTPRITWKQFVKKYGETSIKGYEKHKITQDKAEKILEKYKKLVPPRYRNSMSLLWLNYSPSYYKNSIKKIKECKTCDGLWAIGGPCPMGKMDFNDGYQSKKCPECGKGGKIVQYKK